MEASEYYTKMAARRLSLDRFLDSAKFNDIVIGDVGKISDDLHYQQLDIHIGTMYLVELWKAIVAFEQTSGRDANGRISHRLSSDLSRNAAFNMFVRKNYPNLLMSAVVPSGVDSASELEVDSPVVIDVMYGTMDPRMRQQLLLVKAKNFPQTRLLVLAFYDLQDNCQAAVVLPV